ncbi:MAG: Fic/DOC family N-terminal domain-containing protein [Flavobacteriaceae bacterium]|nr:Fic/DOC family N-terminal domain-containing protein [Flavobacteriaceae bacterium]
MLDIDVAILSKMERGERRITKEVVLKLADIYGCNADELLVSFLSDKILYEIQDEDLGIEALKVAEERAKYLKANKSMKNKAFNNLPILPPKQSLVETIAILKQESKSAVALAELKGLTNTLPNPSILINAVILKEAQASSGIENVITTQDKLYQALYAKSAKPDVATKEVLRYREALLMGTRLIKEKGFLNTNGIIAIQKELEENNAGLRRLPGKQH